MQQGRPSDRGNEDDVGRRRGGGSDATGDGGGTSAAAAAASTARPKTQASILSFLTTAPKNKAARPSAEEAEAPVVLRRGVAEAAEQQQQQQQQQEVPLPAPLPPLPLAPVVPPPPPATSCFGPRLLPPLLDPYAAAVQAPQQQQAQALLADAPPPHPQPPPPPPRLPPHRSEHLSWQLALAESSGGSRATQLRRAAPRLRVSAFWSGAARVGPGVGPAAATAPTPTTASAPPDRTAVVALRPASATTDGRHDRLLAAQAGGALRLLSWGALECAAAEALRARREAAEAAERREEDERSSGDGDADDDDEEDDDGGGAWCNSSSRSTKARRRRPSPAEEEGQEEQPRVAGGCARRRLRRSVRRSAALPATAPSSPSTLLVAQGRATTFDPQLFAADCSPTQPGLFALAGSRGCRLVAATEAGRVVPLSTRPLGGFGGACPAPPPDASNPSPAARDARFFPWQSAAGSYALAVAVSHRRMPCVALHDARCVGGGGGGAGGAGGGGRPPCVTLLAPMMAGNGGGGLGASSQQGEIVSLQVAPGGSLVYGASAAGAVFEWDVRRATGVGAGAGAGASSSFPSSSSSASSFLGGRGGGGGSGNAPMTFGAGGPSRHALLRAFDAHDLCFRAFGQGNGGGALAAAARVPSRTSHVLLDPSAPWRLACVRDDRHVAVLDLRQGGAGQGHGRATHFASAEAPALMAPPTTPVQAETAAAAVASSSSFSHHQGNRAGMGRIYQSCWDAAGDVLYTQGAVWQWPEGVATAGGGGGGNGSGNGSGNGVVLDFQPSLVPALAALDLNARMPHRRDAAAVRAPRGMAPQAARRLLSAPGVGGVAPAQWWRRGWQAVPDPVTCVAQRGDGSGALAVGTLSGEVVCVGHF